MVSSEAEPLIAVYEEAWRQAKAAGDAALEALRMSEQVDTDEAKAAFFRAAHFANIVSENWRIAANRVHDKIQEKGGARI